VCVESGVALEGCVYSLMWHRKGVCVESGVALEGCV
jgi:hypothetical protein